MNNTFRFLVAFLNAFVLLLLSYGSASGQNRLDGINIYQAPRQFPNGYSTLPRSVFIERPNVGTYLTGVVRVKTRVTHGVHKGDNVINGSASNTLLSQFGMNSVTSAFTSTSPSRVADAEIERIAGLDRIYDVKYSDGIDPFDLCMKLMESPDVEYAVPIQIHKPDFIPNDVRYAEQTWLKNMQLEKAWDISKGGKSILIAIVDTGTDYTHDDLSGQIFTNPNEIANNSIDDDGNGYVDDIRGWDFVGNITLAQAQVGQYLPDNDPKVNWVQINMINGHGTVTAGCASATTNNTTGIASPGFNCTIIPIKVAADDPGIGAILGGYSGIKYAADLGAHIINCSWGGPGVDPTQQDIIDYATAKGSLVVASSGNSGLNTDKSPSNPSSLDGVLSVGSSSSTDRPSYNFSNYGWGVDVFAPGENILSTFPGNKYSPVGSTIGTSFSSPFTAGIAALIKSIHGDWTPEMIRQQIRSTSDAMVGVTGTDRPLYYGRVNAEKALRYNQSFSSGDRIPGIIVTNVTISGGRIRNYDPTSIKISLKNVLGDAEQVMLTIEAQPSTIIMLPAGVRQLGTMLNAATRDIDLTIQLTENFPWFDTNLELGLIIQSGSYTDYELVNVPVSLPTSNTFTAIGVPSSTFQHIDYTPVGKAAWSTGILFGAYTGFVTGDVSGNAIWGVTPFLADALEALSAQSAIIGGKLQGNPTISVTANSGSNWSAVNVSSALKSVVGIVMFDNTTGLAIGNPVTNRIGIVKTTDGGSTWTALPNAPVVSGSGETVLPGAVFNVGKSMWFATSSNRILYTTNTGATWSSGMLNAPGAVIVSLAFRDALNGILLYKTSASPTAPYKIASSLDGGRTWTVNVLDPATLGITAALVASPGGHHLLVGQEGEVFGSGDNGASWQVILSKPPQTVAAGVAVSDGGTMLFMAGTMISTLEYKFNNPFGTKILGMRSDTVDFGSIGIGQNRQRFVVVESSGESDVNVDSVVITSDAGTPADAFRIAIALDDVVEAGTTDQIAVRVYGTDTGTYSATLTVYSNSTPPTTSTKLKARVQFATSVDELNEFNISISPNPAFDAVTVISEADGTLGISDLTGRLLNEWEIKSGLPLTISVADKSSGTYLLVVTSRDKRAAYPLHIIK
ncbi:MAG: S8 family serine peptidase [Ignavibacteria bacterium]|nr:S8 family serine peptidase [Ignavibacteria bacterium]